MKFASRSKSIILSVVVIIILIGAFYFVRDVSESEELKLEANIEPTNEVMSLDREEKEIETVLPQETAIAGEQVDAYSFADITQHTRFADYGTDIVSHYSQQLALAEGGSGEAAYELYKLHLMCPYPELVINDPKAAKEESRIFLKNLLDRGLISPEQLEQVKLDEAVCIDMWSVAQKPVEHWYEVAKKSDFPLMKRQQATNEELENSFSKLTGDSLVGGNIYAIGKTVDFYQNVVQDEQLSRVWEYIGCKTHSRCDQAQYARFIQDQFYQYKADAIFSEAEKLIHLIESGEIRNFDFVYRLDPSVEEPVSAEDLFRKHIEQINNW